MTTITHTTPSASKLVAAPRERTGGPGGGRQPEVVKEWIERSTASAPFGSHMPPDTVMHWDWRNPLNIIPAFILLLFVLMVVGLLVG